MLGENIKKLRVRNGFSLRGLADELGVSHQTISKYEKNEMFPSSQMLIKIASIFNVKVGYLFEEAGESIILTNIHYRKSSRFTEKNQAIVEGITKDFIANYLQVLDLFPEGRFPIPDINVLTHEIVDYEDIEQVTLRVREQLNLGIDPIQNLLNSLEEIGFIVIFIDAIAGFDGKEGMVGNMPFIVLNRDSFGDRQRYNLAHELGHILIKHFGLDDERVAHMFAGALLVPKDSLIRDLGKTRTNLNFYELAQLKEKYKVSMQCIIMRAKQVGIISEYEKERLFKQISMRGWRKEEPVTIKNEKSTKFEQMICEAVSEGYISESIGAEYLNISTIDFLQKYMGKRIDDNNQ